MPGTAQCPFHDHDKEDQNDKNQDNAVTMILYDLEEVQDDDDDFILRLSHTPRPAHISGDPLSGQTTLILVIIFGCTLPTTCFFALKCTILHFIVQMYNHHTQHDTEGRQSIVLLYTSKCILVLHTLYRTDNTAPTKPKSFWGLAAASTPPRAALI